MKVIRDRLPTVSGPVFTDDGRANSLYLNELFDAVAKETSAPGISLMSAGIRERALGACTA